MSFIVFCFLGNGRGFVKDDALLLMLLVIHVRCGIYEHFMRHVDITNERKKKDTTAVFLCRMLWITFFNNIIVVCPKND